MIFYYSYINCIFFKTKYLTLLTGSVCNDNLIQTELNLSFLKSSAFSQQTLGCCKSRFVRITPVNNLLSRKRTANIWNIKMFEKYLLQDADIIPKI